MPPKLPYRPISDLLEPSRVKKNPFIEARKRAVAGYRRDPVKVRARKLVANAIVRGDLMPLPCSWRVDGHACGKMPTEAHHRSYEAGMELDVQWLCEAHHDILSTAARNKARRRRLGIVPSGTDDEQNGTQ